MISIRKQLFALLFGTGLVTILLTAISVNTTIKEEFARYIEKNIKETSSIIVARIGDVYETHGEWSEEVFENIYMDTHTANFSVAILDLDKQHLWGMTQEDLFAYIESLDYPLFYGDIWLSLKQIIYTFEDRPIHTSTGELVGYARIGYFPSFLLVSNDIMLQSNINQSIIMSGVVGLICFVFIGIYITMVVTKPVYAIRHTAKALAEGKYRVRYRDHSRITEIEELIQSINYLAQKLEQQDTLRKKLVADVSHEIRTPLHILQSNLEAMIDGIYPIDEEQMQVLYQEVLRFGSLLNNLDKLKNVEENFTEVQLEAMHMNTCIKEVWHAFRIVAKERGIDYEILIDPTNTVMVMGDPGALKQILMNILSNAFKFTRSGRITIRTALRDKKMQIIVSDTGIGIAEEDLPYIFERMYRGDKSREQFEGSGIGLTIVKQLVMAHQGTIDVQSSLNEGTQVTITLPACQMPRNSMLHVLGLKK